MLVLELKSIFLKKQTWFLILFMWGISTGTEIILIYVLDSLFFLLDTYSQKAILQIKSAKIKGSLISAVARIWPIFLKNPDFYTGSRCSKNL
jgi:hypothetical protein